MITPIWFDRILLFLLSLTIYFYAVQYVFDLNVCGRNLWNYERYKKLVSLCLCVMSNMRCFSFLEYLAKETDTKHEEEWVWVYIPGVLGEGARFTSGVLDLDRRTEHLACNIQRLIFITKKWVYLHFADSKRKQFQVNVFDDHTVALKRITLSLMTKNILLKSDI